MTFHSDNFLECYYKEPITILGMTNFLTGMTHIHTICNTKVIAMRRLAIPVTAMRALMAKAKEAEAMDTSMRVSRKIKNFDTSN